MSKREYKLSDVLLLLKQGVESPGLTLVDGRIKGHGCHCFAPGDRS